ncbi:MAG: hypothetical protein Q4E50_02475 [Tissierellia bacterium]|nr:hypothetical protein [Tissierellia bacterium]
MKDKIRKFFAGRYGQDQLGTFLVALAAISMVLRIVSKSFIFNILTLAILIYTNFRVMSKNIYARSSENMLYLKEKKKLLKFFSWTYLSIFGKDGYKYLKCNSCGQELKLPKKKGKVKITCPKCKNDIITRT